MLKIPFNVWEVTMELTLEIWDISWPGPGCCSLFNPGSVSPAAFTPDKKIWGKNKERDEFLGCPMAELLTWVSPAASVHEEFGFQELDSGFRRQKRREPVQG